MKLMKIVIKCGIKFLEWGPNLVEIMVTNNVCGNNIKLFNYEYYYSDLIVFTVI